MSPSKVDEAHLKLGDEVGVKYRGQTVNRAGTGRYHDYALVVERDDSDSGELAVSDVPVDPAGFDAPEVEKDYEGDLPS